MIRASLRSLLGLAFLAVACGGSTEGDGGPLGGACVHDGKLYQPGESYPLDCNTCTCSGGDFACTVMACGNGCMHDGQLHAPGSTFPAGDGCNSCYCDVDGSVSCTLVGCAATCVYEDTTYHAGASFPASDGCNTCSCQADGSIVCTELDCGSVCSYAGKSYQPGESFPALDGCNTCTCASDGSIGCTKIACACDPTAEWWRDYVGTSPQQCATILYACPEHTTPFSNSCGCGCEQDASCPQWFDCKPPAPCDPDLLEKCPYSGVAK
jgi:hypothetical protein